jgi:hypothetical protein
MTSLPADTALYHMRAKVFQRSKGRSSVAAAAYRSASKLTDDRIGETFDYTRKHCVGSFILTPENAPDWTKHRETLWNRVEIGEKAVNAVVGREVEISIPRDIPEDQWQAFAEEICRPYVEAGAVVDVAVHAPTAADKNKNPHLHIMMTTRALDASQPHGFAKKKNDDITRIFESGGRHGGGKRGDALKSERERIAEISNKYLAAAGSARRVSHKSWADLGIEREAEPDMGEERIKKVRRQKRHDRVTAQVSAMRNTRNLENQLTETEDQIMAAEPRFQNSQMPGGIKPRRKQDFKTKLMSERFPDADLSGHASNLYQIDTRNPSLTKIRMRDGGWCEVDENGRTVRVYGPQGSADELAQRLLDSGYADKLDRLRVEQEYKKAGAPKTPKTIPADEAERLAERWRERGFTKVDVMPDGAWVTIGTTRIQDLGDTLRIHGKPSDAACAAMVEKAVDEWGSECEVRGSQAFKDSIWLAAQRRGVTVYDELTGQLYQPSPDVKARFDKDRKKAEESTNDVAAISADKKLSGLLKGAAAGDSEALTRLENNDEDLANFVSFHLDDEQRKNLAQEPDEKLVAALKSFREYGAKAKADQEQAGEDKKVVSLSERLRAKAERQKEMELEAERGNAPKPQ